MANNMSNWALPHRPTCLFTAKKFSRRSNGIKTDPQIKDDAIMPEQWRPVTKTEPCNLCSHPNWCARSADGAHRCQRPPPQPPAGWKAVGKGETDGAIIYRRMDDKSAAAPTPLPRPSGPRTVWANPELAAQAIAERQGALVHKIHPYPNADSTIGFWIVRLNPKDFRPLHRTATGIAAGDPKNGAKLPLYRLPEIINAPSVVVCEGEKCADAAWSVGVAATTSAHGCKSPAKTDWAPLAGRTVYLCPDNDDPGRTYVRAVAKILDELTPAVTMRLLELPGLEPKGDMADWIAARDSVESAAIGEQLMVLIEAARTYAVPRVGPVLVRMDTVEEEEIDWCWFGRVAFGQLNLITGEPEVGKSFNTVDLASRLSVGAGWPDSPHEPGPQCSSILIGCEDGKAQAIKKRLRLCGADASRVSVLDGFRRPVDVDTVQWIDLSVDLGAIEAMIRADPAVRLLVFDPLSAYIGETDSHKDAEVRRVLTPLCGLAERLRIAVVGIMHTNKATGQKAFLRISGAAAFYQLARCAFAIGRDPADDDRRFMVPMKCSGLIRRPPALAFRFCDEGLKWELEPVQVTADDLFSDKKRSTKGIAVKEAKDWLIGFLGDGPRRANEVYEQGDLCGHNERTLRRAKRELGVRSDRLPDGEGGHYAVWRLAAGGHVAAGGQTGTRP